MKNTSFEWASELLPKREENSNKSTFGKLTVISGSKKYRGAAHLCVESALRGGIGYLYYLGEEELCQELRMKFPEVIYNSFAPLEGTEKEEASVIANDPACRGSVLIGPGSGLSKGLYNLTEAFILSEGGALTLDADAINSLAKFCPDPIELFRRAKREIILTPHPLEFSRLSGLPLELISNKRAEVAKEYAEKAGVTLLLKGNGTVVTDGEATYINTSGSSAIAKAGSGDVLSGLLAAMTASCRIKSLDAAALAAYIHGKAGDSLAEELSEYGVLISELPREMARVINQLQKAKNANN